jgi:hypothetical protein
MSTQDIPLIIYYPDYQFDKRSDRTLEYSAPRVAQYIEEHYIDMVKTGPAWLKVRRDLRPPSANVSSLENYPCPIH